MALDSGLGVGGWVAVTVTTVTALVLAYLFGPAWAKSTAAVMGVVIGAIAALAAIVAALVALILGLKWLVGLVPASVWSAIGSVIAIIFTVAVIAFLLATVGQLVKDQIRSTGLAGSERLGVTMGAIAVGSSLAVLMLAGNAYNAYAWYPSVIAQWADNTLRAKDPKFDAVVTLVIVGLSAIGVLRSLVRLRPSPTMAEFGRSLIYAVFGFVMAAFVLALGKDND